MGSEKSADFEGLRVIGADEPLDAELDRSVASSVPLAYAVVLAGDQPGRVYVLHRNTSVIGRVENAEICLTDASVSARHARIINGSRGFEIVRGPFREDASHAFPSTASGISPQAVGTALPRA